MISDRRLKEAEMNLKRYFEEDLIKKTDDNVALDIIYRNSSESLRAASVLIKEDISLWAIVASYYCMFYIASAVLLKKGYKTTGKIVHKVVSDALIVLVRPELKENLIDDYESIQEEALRIAEVRADDLVQNFEYERIKRGNIQYNTPKEDITSKAKTSLERAKEFLFEMEKILSR